MPRTPRPFRATLEPLPGNLQWTIARVPANVAKLFGKHKQQRAKGEINGIEFRGWLTRDASGDRVLLVTKKMQRVAGVRVGGSAQFLLQPDLDERKLVMPAELARILREEKQLAKFFASLTPSMQRWFADSVSNSKQAAVRERRANQWAELMLETIEAERELPPIIKLAIANTPDAERGWRRMTPRMRRQELMGVFYYRNLESRTRRLEKAIELMLKCAEKNREN